jgi:hypothetical protein
VLEIALSLTGVTLPSSISLHPFLPVCRYISYPRTESTQYPATFDLRAAVRAQTTHPVWGGYAGRLLEGDNMQARPQHLHIDNHTHRTSVHSSGHPPIHVTFCVDCDCMCYRVVVVILALVQAPRRGHDAGDHPPITPVRVPGESMCVSTSTLCTVAILVVSLAVLQAGHSDLHGEAGRLYDMIARHFLATVRCVVCPSHPAMLAACGDVRGAYRLQR